MLAGGVFVLVALGAEGQRLRHGGDSVPSLIASWLLIMAVCGALLFRRRYPVTVGWFTVLATGAYYLLSDIDGPLIVVPVVVLYANAAQGRVQAATAMAAAMVIGVSVGTLAGIDLDDYVYGALRAGATGFLVKDTEPEELLQAVRVAARGDALISPSVTRRLIAEFAGRVKGPEPDPRLDVLTDREREVMQLVAAGLTNDEIAARLVLSPSTAKTHVSRIMTKLRARDRSQVVVLAYESGMVSPGWLAGQTGRRGGRHTRHCGRHTRHCWGTTPRQPASAGVRPVSSGG